MLISIVSSNGSKKSNDQNLTQRNETKLIYYDHVTRGPKSNKINNPKNNEGYLNGTIEVDSNVKNQLKPNNRTFDPNSVEHFISLEALQKLKNREKKRRNRHTNIIKMLKAHFDLRF